jgi:hypothetical protein
LRAALAALTLTVSLAAHGPARAQRIVDAPLVAGWGFAHCTDVQNMAGDPTARSEIGQWALGYYSGLLALDVEGAVPQFTGLDAWLRRTGANGANVAAPIAERIVAVCQSAPELSVEVASQRVALAVAAEARR